MEKISKPTHQIQPSTSCLREKKKEEISCSSPPSTHYSNPFLRPPHPLSPSLTPSQSQPNTPPPHRRIHQTRIHTLIYRYRPHAEPPTRPVTHRQRILNRKVRLALDSAQVEAQTALAARGRRGAEGGGWGRACSNRHRHGDRIRGVEDGVGSVIRERELGSGEGGVCVCGCLCKAQVAFGEGGNEEGASAVVLYAN